MNAPGFPRSDRKPIVGIPACFRDMAGTRFHMAMEEYVLAVSQAVDAIPVIVPALPLADMEPLLSRLDGMLITGSPSNVDPARYGGVPGDPGALHDPVRDAADLELIPALVDAEIPLLAICRGFQELNVAYGGTLHQKLQELPGRLDHRAPLDADPDIQYAARHPVRLAEGGLLRRLLGTDSVTVNSLHWQGIDRLGQGLAVEAVADDRTIEAVRIEGARAFSLAVQWHPEYRPADNPVSRAIFGAFAEAVRVRQRRSMSAMA